MDGSCAQCTGSGNLAQPPRSIQGKHKISTIHFDLKLSDESKGLAVGPLYQGTTQWVPPICPVLADVGSPIPDQPLLYQRTTQWVPPICPVLADVGSPIPRPAAFVSGHDPMGAPYLPGFGRCGKPDPKPTAFVSAHDFTACGKKTQHTLNAGRPGSPHSKKLAPPPAQHQRKSSAAPPQSTAVFPFWEQQGPKPDRSTHEVRSGLSKSISGHDCESVCEESRSFEGLRLTACGKTTHPKIQGRPGSPHSKKLAPPPAQHQRKSSAAQPKVLPCFRFGSSSAPSRSLDSRSEIRLIQIHIWARL